MSTACTPATATSTRPGSRLMEMAAWAGLACGLMLFFGGVARACAPEHRLYAAAWPTPKDITEYSAAIFGALLTAANTLYVIWHKFHPPERKPRRRKKARREASPPAPG